jgi:hypothetical protein
MRVRVTATVDLNPDWYRHRYGRPEATNAEVREAIKVWGESALESLLWDWQDDYERNKEENDG